MCDKIFDQCIFKNNLTNREIAVLWSVIQGLDNKSIAKLLSIAPCTVKFHLASLYRKTGTKNRTELTKKVFMNFIDNSLDYELFLKLLSK